MSTVTAGQAARLSGWRGYVAELWARREFVWFLAMGNLKARNASTSLGLMWWVLNPLLMSAVYFLVFGVIFPGREGEGAFLSYLLSGMFVFNFTTISMTSGANSILQNSKLLANIRFPRLILPLSALVEALVGFLTSLLVFYLLAGPIDGIWPTASILVLLLAIPIQTAFNLGLASMTARLAVPFRDVNNLLPHLTRIWLYLSPIIWPLSFMERAPEWAQMAAQLNPMWSIIALYRWALLDRPAAIWEIGAAFGWAIVLVFVGVVGFARQEGNMVRYL